MDDRNYATIPGGRSRNGMPAGGGYVYRGTGEDRLTPPAVMTEWNRQLREHGADPYTRTREGSARLAEVQGELARGRVPAPPARPPAAPAAPADVPALYWPAYYPGPGVSGRCPDCGYMLKARGHEVSCGR